MSLIRIHPSVRQIEPRQPATPAPTPTPTDPHQKQYVPLLLCWGTYKAKAMTITSLTVVKKGNGDYFFRSKLNAITNKKSLVQTTCAVYAIKIVT